MEMERWQSWSIASDLKSDEFERTPWVRIPPSPLIAVEVSYLVSNFSLINDTACPGVVISSAAVSGISKLNSSSIDITNSS